MNRKFNTLAQRMDVMMRFNAQFSSTLSQIFSVGASSSSAVQFLIPLIVPGYPPPDSPDEEGGNDDRSSS